MLLYITKRFGFFYCVESFHNQLLYRLSESCLYVGVIGNLVHSSPNIKKEVISSGALQPVIGLLRCVETRHFNLHG